MKQNFNKPTLNPKDIETINQRAVSIIRRRSSVNDHVLALASARSSQRHKDSDQ